MLAGTLGHAVEGRHDILIAPQAEAAWSALLTTQDRVLREAWQRAVNDSLVRQCTSPREADLQDDDVFDELSPLFLRIFRRV